MRVAALYDIHGNLPALEAVLAAVEDECVDRIVIGGDVVPGPLPVETIQRLRELGDRAVFVGGNGDRSVVEAFDTLDAAERERPRGPWAEWTAETLDRRARDLLASFSAGATLEVEELGPVLFCHASPRDDEEILTSLAPDRRWRSALEGVEESLIVCGHTHSQFDRRVGRWRVLNAGSVGLPYEGRAGAYWLLLGPGIAFRRTEYDVEAALVAMRAGGNLGTDALVHDSLVAPIDRRTAAELLDHQACSR
jgi:predicted phosphodiesterase